MILLTGQEFALAGAILNVLILAVAAIFFGTMFTYLVVAMGLQRAMVKYYLLAAVLGLGAYFIFIPKYYYWAAAIITVLIESLIWFWAWRLVSKKIKIKLSNLVLVRSLLAAIVVFLLFYKFRFLPVILLVVLVSLSYFVLLFLFKAVDKNKIRLILGKDKYV
jgi:O-antigen/teichoic acid export membrane protein